MNLLLWSLIILTVGCVSERSRSYPIVENDPLANRDGSVSEFIWNNFHDGGDFSVSYGAMRDDPTTKIGLYFGLHPDVPSGHSVSGKLGDFAGTWIIRDGFPNSLRREFLTKVKRGLAPRHVWLSSESKAGLDRAVAELNKLNAFSAGFEKRNRSEAERVMRSIRRESGATRQP
ncbi:MAG TPA: hypothetical protein VK633_13140 [Verrucomicrobiae bacterium]|nr:hypothetical protein [Verrucomicrobiae bacterium]